ncbi:glycosyltransferase domain-containing protein [Solemya velum gill symbiont]|uniref:glycosyltransferase domain-containing protein n=1 Tax=Solemya velum gill symbiont TaxID=2340 RepID=UPI0009964BEA|nr:glycosyltransferase domain-containing protein [Solemya velum gill symbiont]OOZ44774.1 hypothetical protein BOW37_05700 [Solemya velum gill symbiont]OOZ46900.1 hypothetical protein BOW38_05920 [Solemya velum gill symbiont]OOZ50603.1 hypothetical protein BOW39_02285 [Solemya velum gill symbiont]OOZ51848.1 hypothetical protein BOW40_05760 [Solemya velum gill symbiont]OOZ54390.1 hypothetical protein BOW41_06465 [Solemya velum gill symbiont]
MDNKSEGLVKRRVIYTVLIGGYEGFIDSDLQTCANTDLICFTDSEELTSNNWEVRRVAARFPGDSIRSSRYLKIMGPVILDDYEESLYIDNSVLLTTPPDELLDQFLDGVEFALPHHSFRTSVAAEFDAVDSAGFDDPSRIYEQMLHYLNSNPGVMDEKPYSAGILARRHSPLIKEVMTRWWEHVLRYSRRDQLSLNYVLNEFEINMKVLEIDIMGSDFHQWPVETNRNNSLAKASTVYDAIRSIPTCKIGALQNEVDRLRVEAETINSARENAGHGLPIDLFRRLLNRLNRKK